MTVKPPRRRPPKAVPSRNHSRRDISLEFNYIALIITIAIGAAAWLIGSIVYNSIVDSVSRPVLMGIVWAILCLMLFAGVLTYSKISDSYEECPIDRLDGVGGIALFFAASAILIIGLTVFF